VNFQLAVLLVYAISMTPLGLKLTVDVASSDYDYAATRADAFATLIVLLVLVSFAVFAIVQMIQGALKGKDGLSFRYLMNLRLLRLGEPDDRT